MKSGKSIFKLSRSQWISVAVLASSLGLAVAVTVPNSFTAGTPASATQVNDNFTALVTAVTAAETALTTAQARITALEAPKTTHVGVMAYAFMPQTDLISWGGCGLVADVPFRSMTNVGAPWAAAAPIYFPDGATLTNLQAKFFDFSATLHATVYLRRYDGSLNNFTNIGQVETTDAEVPGGVSKTASLTHTVDNTGDTSYYLVWEQNGAGAPCNTLGLYTVLVTYTK